MIERIYMTLCDACLSSMLNKENEDIQFDSREQAEKYAKHHGWECSDDEYEHLCLKCQEERGDW